MKVSVVIPLYNKAPYFKRTLDSVLGQSFGDYQVIVVDDGSTDGGERIAADCGDRRVRLVRQANAGPAAARNHGLELASGEYVVFMDADDRWFDDFLKTSVRLLDGSPQAACVSSGYVKEPGGRSTLAMWRQRGLGDGLWRLEPHTNPMLAVHLLAYMSPWNTLARTDIIRRWGGFCRHGRCLYGEDSFLWLKVLLNHVIRVNLQPLVHFHTEASALSANLSGPRPIEPILLYPDEEFDSCPEALRPLLRSILAIRAAKTACLLGYWGRWRSARALLQQFCPWSSWRLPLFGAAQVSATPMGAMAGVATRLMMDRARQAKAAMGW